MTKQEKDFYKDKRAVAVCSMGLVGLECLDILYGIDDYMIVRGYTGDLHKVKIYYTDNPYIRLYGRRFNTSDFMRI